MRALLRLTCFLAHTVAWVRGKPTLQLPHKLLRGHLQGFLSRPRHLDDLPLSFSRRRHEPDRAGRERHGDGGERERGRRAPRHACPARAVPVHAVATFLRIRRRRRRRDGRCRDRGEPRGQGHGDRAVARAVEADEVLKARARLHEVEEVLEALLTLEVELALVRPDVLTDLEHDEQVEHMRLALRGGSREKRGVRGRRGGAREGVWERVGGVRGADE